MKGPSRGKVYKRKGKTKTGKPVSKYWQAEFYYKGRMHRFSTGVETTKAEAEKVLDKRLETIRASMHLPQDQSKTTLGDLVNLLRRDYQLQQRKSWSRARTALYQLVSYFGQDLRHKSLLQTTDEELIEAGKETPALTITLRDLEQYQDYRLAQQWKGKPIAPGTVNKELMTLQRMFRLAMKSDWLASMPKFPEKLPENPPREGFLRLGDVQAIVEHLPEHLADVVWFAFWSGWRQAKILGLTWDEVDLQQCTIKLKVDKQSKQKRTSDLVLDHDHPLMELLRHRWEHKVNFASYVFHRKGKQLKWPRPTWETAIRKAGYYSKDQWGRVSPTFHDLRRSAVRLAVDAGMAEKAIMELTGHSTRSVFNRYNITEDEDIRQVTRAMANKAKEQQASKVTPIKASKGSKGYKGYKGYKGSKASTD